MKENILVLLGVTGSYIAGVFGGWNSAIATLCFLIVADSISGFVVASIFKNSPKTESGTLKSSVGWKGLSRKCMILLYVLIGQRLDIMLGISYIKDGICIGFIINEIISITENSALMGVPVPKFITNAIDLLQNKEGSNNDK